MLILCFVDGTMVRPLSQKFYCDSWRSCKDQWWWRLNWRILSSVNQRSVNCLTSLIFFGVSVFLTTLRLSTPGRISSGVRLKPRHCMLVAQNSHFGNFAFKPTFLSLEKSFSNCIKCSYQGLMAQMVERLLCTRRTRVQIPAPAPYEIRL